MLEQTMGMKIYFIEVILLKILIFNIKYYL